MARTLVNFEGRERRVSVGDARRQAATMRGVLDRLKVQPGVVLSDEVGMGKTYVALGTVADYLGRYQRSRVLILTPSSDLAEKWTRDLERFRRENVNASVGKRMSMTSDLYNWRLEELLSTKVKSRIWILPVSAFLSSRRADERRQNLELVYHLISRAASLEREARRVFWRRLGGRGRAPRPRTRLMWLDERLPSFKKTVRKVLRDQDLWPFDPEAVAQYRIKPLIDQIRWMLIRSRMRRFGLIVVDEAHHLKNPDSKQYSALEAVFHDCFRDMLFLTATPFQLGPEELQSMLRLFRHSQERSSSSMDREAERVTSCAQQYQDLVRAFEDAWQALNPAEKAVVCEKELRGIGVAPAFKAAYEALCQGHRELQAILGKWVVRNVKDREYRETIQTPIPITSQERVPFAVLHRLLYEYQRQRPTFSAVQSLSLTSSWEAFRGSAVMRGPAGAAGSVAFYRNVMRELLGQNGAHHPKLSALSRTVQDEIRQGEKVLIFTSRLESVRALQTTLNAALEERIYARLRPLSKEEVDHRLRNLRKRVTTERDFLGLLFRENYCAYLRSRPSARDIYPDIVRELARFGGAYRVGLKGKAHGPNWDSLATLCECIVFGRQHHSGTLSTVESLRQYWSGDVVQAVNLKHRAVRRLTADQEREILRSHYCTKEQLVGWLDRILKHRSVWEPYRDVLDKIEDLDLREELLSAVGRALFVPEILGAATLALNRGDGRHAERALMAAATASHVQTMVRRFLEEMVTLPAEEVRSFARGLRTENLVARASGDESVEDRRRYRYGFNTPFRPYVLVASEVMQEGIDLHRECSRIVHYDLAWNPARLEQRVGRVDRLGSKVDRELKRDPRARLKIHRRYLPGTIDERMHLRVGDRERWFKFILGHRPEWEDDGNGAAGGALLPDAFGNRLKIVLAPAH